MRGGSFHHGGRYMQPAMEEIEGGSTMSIDDYNAGFNDGYEKAGAILNAQFATLQKRLEEADKLIEAIKTYDAQRKAGSGLYADWQPVEDILYSKAFLNPPDSEEDVKI